MSYRDVMAWLWWLLAPIVTTFLGGLTAWWRSRRSLRRDDPRRAMAVHRTLLATLAQHESDVEGSVTVVVLPAELNTLEQRHNPAS